MQKYLKFSLVFILAIALVAVGTISCGGGAQEEKEAYKIGALFSTTGSQSNLGVPEENTVEMLVEKINADGGINGHDLEVIIYNDETDSTKCATLANKLIEQDQVLAIIGPTGTGNSMAIIDAITTAEIPLVSCAAGASIVTPVDERYWIFKTPQTDKQVVIEIYIYLQSINISKVAIITSTSGFGQGGKTYLESEAATYGITIVDNQTFGSDDTSMISQLTHIKGTDAEAVICWDTDKASAVVAKDMQTLQMTIPLYCSHGIANQAFIDAAGDAANGVIFPAGKLLVVDEIPASDPQKEVLTNYRDEYLAAYPNESISTFGGHAYDALYLVVDALENMEEDLTLAESRAAIRDGLEQITDFVGISGIFTMSPEDHLGMQPGSLALIEIVDGAWTLAQ
jgi:branched-chain amino acid transport system substrate-binding protein